MQFNKRDTLVIGAHTSENGLNYHRGMVTACESGSSGGWDVVDVKDSEGNEFSIYGFSIERVIPAKPLVTDFEVIKHGIMRSDYFQGCGVSNFEAVQTGIGRTVAEAITDALDVLAENFDITQLETAINMDTTCASVPEDCPESYWFVSIRVSCEDV